MAQTEMHCTYRKLTGMSEYGRKVAGKVKARNRDIKRNVQGTNREGKKTGTQINDLEQKEKINT